MEKKYETYNAAQFLKDPFFIEWVKNNSNEANTFWNNWEALKPQNLNEMNDAKEELKIILSAKRLLPKDKDEEEVLARIKFTINQQEKNSSNLRKLPKSAFPHFKIWAAAASIIIILVGGIFYATQKSTNNSTIAKNTNPSLLENDIAPGGNKAVLTLADGSKIILDSVNNGLLAQQGNIKIIKLNDGRLTYDKLMGDKKEAVLYNTITTPKGGQYQFTLSDGSKVWLNAKSSLRFPAAFTGKERKVELTGEGYFEIASIATLSSTGQKESKPFIVAANNTTIKVLGTHFNINAYTDENFVTTTLLEGSVKVSKGNASVMIAPGEQSSINNLTNKINIKEGVDLDETVAWKNGLFYFSHANLQTVLRHLARWYNVEITYQGNIPKRVFEGKIQRSLNLSEVLKILETNNVHFKIEGKKIVVTP